ncbi:hypothetical protein GQ43DRAFT_445083 [Delitschia confertaspora ATCC 74209]|uniref:Apple domain-containing protein n=1 Tax=Delitschia confertaspora ATCC 74209 TaxID=1513339 RepID=A0A9P4MMT9_9PLEO|nr:hypothetical protein GQ43DRAFT_445083 [Delitschia confertaspora ATCC 74209]
MDVLGRIFLILTFASCTTASYADTLPTSNRPELSIRATSACPPSYTTKNGLDFVTYCSTDNTFNDAFGPFTVDSMPACMLRCSRFWGTGEGCFGIVFRESDKQCWLKNSTAATTKEHIFTREGYHSALLDPRAAKLMKDGYDQTCPYEDMSAQTLEDEDRKGLGFTTYCGHSIADFDYCPQEFPSCLKNTPFFGFFHASSLKECVEICARQHPLCRAATYNPGLEIGWANCFAKTGWSDDKFITPPKGHGTVHAAIITSIKPVDTECPKESEYTTVGGSRFDIQCGKLNTGTNITSLHTQNLAGCMDACAESDQGCIGVVFDSSLQNGYQNCYLQNTTNIIQDQPSASFAILAGTKTPSSTLTLSSTSKPTSTSTGTVFASTQEGTPNNEKNDKKKSKAWIAGPVIGGLAALALIFGAIFLWRRKRNNKGAAILGDEDSYVHPMHHGPPRELDASSLPNELGAMDPKELKGSTKYAYETGEWPVDSKAMVESEREVERFEMDGVGIERRKEKEKGEVWR